MRRRRWRRRRYEGRRGEKGGGLLTWHMIDGFSVFDFFFDLLVLVIGGVVERRRGMVFNTAGAGGEDYLSSVCVWKRRRSRFAVWVHSLKGVKGLREERASSQRSHRVAQLKAIPCLGE